MERVLKQQLQLVAELNSKQRRGAKRPAARARPAAAVQTSQLLQTLAAAEASRASSAAYQASVQRLAVGHTCHSARNVLLRLAAKRR
jgi:hypothetical protein